MSKTNKTFGGLLVFSTLMLFVGGNVVHAEEIKTVKLKTSTEKTIESLMSPKNMNKEELKEEIKKNLNQRVYITDPNLLFSKDVVSDKLSFSIPEIGKKAVANSYMTVKDAKLISGNPYYLLEYSGEVHGWVKGSDIAFLPYAQKKVVEKYDTNKVFAKVAIGTETVEHPLNTKEAVDETTTRVGTGTPINIINKTEIRLDKDMRTWYKIKCVKDVKSDKKGDNTEKEVLEGWILNSPNEEAVTAVSFTTKGSDENIEYKGLLEIKSDTLSIFEKPSVESSIKSTVNIKGEDAEILDVKQEEVSDSVKNVYLAEFIDAKGNPVKDKSRFYIDENTFTKESYAKIIDTTEVKSESDTDNVGKIINDSVISNKALGLKGFGKVEDVKKDTKIQVLERVIVEHNGSKSLWLKVSIDGVEKGFVRSSNVKMIIKKPVEYTLKDKETVKPVLDKFDISEKELEKLNADKDVKKLKSGDTVTIEGGVVDYVRNGNGSTSGYELVEDLLPAVPAIKEAGLFPSIAFAQAILESGGGTSQLAREDNNLFGIKGSYKGNSNSWATQEDTGGGSMITINANFRSYPSKVESIMDYVDLIANSGIYNRALGAETPEDSITKIWLSGYATDSMYPSKVMSIVKNYDLTQLDK